jgi:hypothetical protein
MDDADLVVLLTSITIGADAVFLATGFLVTVFLAGVLTGFLVSTVVGFFMAIVIPYIITVQYLQQ